MISIFNFVGSDNTEEILEPLLTREETEGDDILLVADAYFDTNNKAAGNSQYLLFDLL